MQGFMMFVLRALTVIFLAVVAGAGLLTMFQQEVQAGTEQQIDVQYNQVQNERPSLRPEFMKIAEDADMILEVETTSISSGKSNSGETLVAGLTRITIKAPVTPDVFFLNTVIAFCSSNRLSIVRASSYDVNGVRIDDLKERQELMNLSPNSIGGISYAFLCQRAGANGTKPPGKTVPMPAPIPSYTPNERYKNLWI